MTQLEIQRVADGPTDLYQSLEEQIMVNIIKHCKDWKQPIASDEWLMRKLAEIGKLNQENIRIIAEATGLNQKAMENMLNEVAGKVLDEVEPALTTVAEQGLAGEAVPITRSKNVKQVMKTMQSQAKDILNVCNSTMLYKAKDAYERLVKEVTTGAKEIENKQNYLDILNDYTTSMVTGVEARQQALRKCIEDFNKKGIPAFVDRRGREWTPEAYVNMCMRSTSNTMAAEIQMARADDYGINLVEVDSHSGARPKCARDQGKIFDRNNASEKYPHWNTSSYGEPDGILGINCRHHIYPFVEGVSIRRHFPTENLKANDKLYKQTQVQRALERDVRKQKRLCMMYDELEDAEGFVMASVGLKEKETKLTDYVDKHENLHRRKDREQVVGFDKEISAKATKANKKHVEKYSRYHYNKSGNIIATDDWKKKERVSIPKKYKPYAVIETIENKKGTQYTNRTIYDENGRMKKQIHSGNHANPKQHPYGSNGEHAHDYEWENGAIVNRITRELNTTERKENSDIL